MLTQPTPPQSLSQLLQRANELSGMTLGELANKAQITPPHNLTRHKGWPGMLIEWHLGASAGSKPEQDFPHLGVELKTLPIDRNGIPLETTFICIAPLYGETAIQWEQSNVRNKLSRVLWIPILAERSIAVTERVVSSPLLWSPSPEEETLLKEDWEELMEMIALGQISQITARHGQVLQLRPKGANSSVRTAAIDDEGKTTTALPRGFYLKKNFTRTILQNSFSSQQNPDKLINFR